MIKNVAAMVGVVAAACSASGRRDGLQGIVELHERQLGFEVQGRLRELAVRRGQRVDAGQVIAVLDDAMERPVRDARAEDLRAAQAQLDLLRAGSRAEDVRATEAQLRGARAAEDNANEQLARMRELRKRAVVPQSQLDETVSVAARAKAEREAVEERLRAQRSGSRAQEIRAAEARVEAAKAALEAEETRLARHILRSPIAGAILDTSAEPGEVLLAGTPVATLGETKRPYVDVFVAQQDVGGVRVGSPATVRVDSSRTAFRATVEDVAREMEFTPRFLFSPRERSNLVVRVRIAIEDPGEELHAGIPAFATIGRAGDAAEARR